MTMQKKRILFVVNYFSGNTAKESIPAMIEAWTAEHGFDPLIYAMKGKKDAEKIEELVEKEKPSVIVAAGGDGTCNLVAKIVMNTPVRMGIIPLGSANGMARELNIPRDPAAALDIIATGETSTIDILRVNNEHYSIHLSDVGLNAKIIRRFEREKRRGWWGYARQLIRELFYVKKYHFEIITDGLKYHRTAISITFANARHFGTGAVINPLGKLDDGKFEVCIIRPFPLYYLLALTVKFFWGRINESKYIQIISCKEAIVRCRRKLTLQVDGEVTGYTKEVRVQVVPSAVMVIVPPASA
jgi:diacylglycerol kinase (ATP)